MTLNEALIYCSTPFSLFRNLIQSTEFETFSKDKTIDEVKGYLEINLAQANTCASSLLNCYCCIVFLARKDQIIESSALELIDWGNELYLLSKERFIPESYDNKSSSQKQVFPSSIPIISFSGRTENLQIVNTNSFAFTINKGS